MASYADVARAWATQSEKRKTSRRLHYEGDLIYSYGTHFPIARHFTNSRGEPGVLFTTKTHSQSTSNHKRKVLRAIACAIRLPVYFCPDPTAPDPLDILLNAHKAARERLKKAERAHSRKAFFLEDAANTAASALATIRFVQGKGHAVPQNDSLAALKKKIGHIIVDHLRQWHNHETHAITEMFRGGVTRLRLSKDRASIEVHADVGVPGIIARIPTKEAAFHLATLRGVMAKAEGRFTVGPSARFPFISHVSPKGGVFLKDGSSVPWSEIEYVANELGLLDVPTQKAA